MHGPGKGISGSAQPFKRTAPSWLKTTTPEVTDLICKLAKKGLTPSQIGVILRDSHGIGKVKFVTGSKVLRILKANGTSSPISGRLHHLLRPLTFNRATYNLPISILSLFLRSCPRAPRGSLPPRQEGRGREEAPREVQEGQGCQVQAHSHRVAYPPSLPLLPPHEAAAPQLEVRVFHGLGPRRLSGVPVHDYLKYVLSPTHGSLVPLLIMMMIIAAREDEEAIK